MFKAAFHIERLRRDRLGQLILDVAEEHLEDALDAGPIAAAGIDPVEDLDALALIVDTVPYEDVRERFDALPLPEEPAKEPKDISSSKAQPEHPDEPNLLAEIYGVDVEPPEPERALRSIAVVDGDFEHERVMAWIQKQLPELHRISVAGVDAVGNEALAIAVIDDKLVATSGLPFIEDAASALQGGQELPLIALLGGGEGGEFRVVNASLDSLGDVMTRIGDALPDSVSGIRDIDISLDLENSALSFLAEAQMSSPGAARVAVTALEGVRAAWAVAGFGKRMPGLRPAISNLNFNADDGVLTIGLALDERQSRSLVNEVIDILEEDLEDEDW